jgi:hypothetical protein
MIILHFFESSAIWRISSGQVMASHPTGLNLASGFHGMPLAEPDEV